MMATHSDKQIYPRGSFAERLVQVIELAGSRRALAQAAGIPESTLQMCLQRRSDPSLRLVLAIARASSVDVYWLVTGEGAPRKVAQLDEELLSDVIGAVEQGIRETRATGYASPAKKAQLIAELYRQFSEEQPMKPAKAGPRSPRLLRLVQRRLVA
jgi:DNA-binding phage protein